MRRRALGRYAWQAGHTRIYPELVKMAEEGLVAVGAAGPRGRVQALEPDDARTLVGAIAEHCAAEVARLRPVMAEIDDEEGADALPFGRLAGEYGVRQYEAVPGWARWSLERLDAAEAAGREGSTSEGAGSPG